MASSENSTIKEEIVEPEYPHTADEPSVHEVENEACKNDIVEESVDELLARAERMIAENQVRIEMHQRSFDIINNLDETIMDEMVQNTLASADQAILMAQQTLDESSLDESVLEVTELQRPNATHVISDGDDDDDVVFVSHFAAPFVPLVDLSVDSPSPVAVDELDLFRQAQQRRMEVESDHHFATFVAQNQILESMLIPPTSSVRAPPPPVLAHRRNRAQVNVAPTPALPVHHNRPAEPSSYAEDTSKRARIEDEPPEKAVRCAVCLENPFLNRPTSTVCGHVFCHPCITMALKQNKKCPMCNRKLAPKQIHMLYI